MKNGVAFIFELCGNTDMLSEIFLRLGGMIHDNNGIFGFREGNGQATV